jgi:DNA-binding CsgD family transcriptional regulator
MSKPPIIIDDNHPLLTLSAKIVDICKPLEEFGIHHFTYLKQLSNGQRISLSNKPQWIADYYNLSLYQTSLFEKPFEGVTSTFNAWFGDFDLDVYWHGKEHYNTMHSISIVEYKRDSCESFLFSTTPDNQQAIYYLSNNREILFHFIMYFKDSAKDILKEASKNSITIPGSEWRVPEEYTKWFQNPAWEAALDERKENFFLKTPIRRVTLETPLGPVVLTQREVMCIYHLLNYKSVSEAAKLMNLSQRTVESYLENIKNKLSCTTKADLLQILQNSPYWPVWT